jgi:hypothetical protein
MGTGFSIFISSLSICIELIIIIYLFYHNRSKALSSGYSKCPVTFRERLKIEKLVQNIELGDMINISMINEQNMVGEIKKMNPSDNDSKNDSRKGVLYDLINSIFKD